MEKRRDKDVGHCNERGVQYRRIRYDVQAPLESLTGIVKGAMCLTLLA